MEKLSNLDLSRGYTEAEYAQMIEEQAMSVLEVMSQRVGVEDVARIRRAYEFAKQAHRMQRRKSGAPYIMHPVAVAAIVAEELQLDANSVISAFLHDIVEDTEYTLDDIRRMFGDDVAFLVDVVTKKKKDHYKMSKQVDNYDQLLQSLQYDIRALMVKLADRLHNMRTLSSMRPDKQMKIAGETDYFYAPLANRMGLFDIKTDLENLSLKYRCPIEYAEIDEALHRDMDTNETRLKLFCSTIQDILRSAFIDARAEVYYRKPYSIWRKMKSQDRDYNHIENRYYVRVTYVGSRHKFTEKNACLKIYSLLTDKYKERPQSFVNQIDSAKENSYQSLNVMLLSEEGVWEDVQITTEHMVETSKIGCLVGRDESNVGEWIDRFKRVLEDIAKESTSNSFIESVVTSLYYDDVMVFTPTGRAIVLPKGATAIDFAFELGDDIGMHAQYARINGRLCSIKTELKRGDCVEIGTSDTLQARREWSDCCSTYKAKRELKNIKDVDTNAGIVRCPACNPIPGCEVIGFKNDDGTVTIHRRSCSEAIHVASKRAELIVTAELQSDPNKTYLISVRVRAIDRYHLLMDLIDTITTKLHLSIDSLKTETVDNIVDCTINFFVHNMLEQTEATRSLYNVDGVDELKIKTEE
ncbi:MAG: HD domain-containing protein [Prevotella sp.]|nr:HD domain-containing protein [Prevotella sp.]